jgi:hypothetical protein
VDEAARRRRQGTGLQGTPGPGNRAAGPGSSDDDPRSQADAALIRLVRGNPPGRLILASVYALGYGALGMARAEPDEPEWFAELDPLRTPAGVSIDDDVLFPAAVAVIRRPGT